MKTFYFVIVVDVVNSIKNDNNSNKKFLYYIYIYKI